MATFNHRLLRQWRDESGMKPEEVAYRADVSFSHLLRLESLGGNPSADLLARIAVVYGHDVSELYHRPRRRRRACRSEGNDPLREDAP